MANLRGRETTLAHPDLNAILDALLPFAQEMLKRHGEFYPFGASMSPDGIVASVAGDVGKEHPPSREVVTFLSSAFTQQASSGVIRAAGICFDARTIPPGATEKSDAIAAMLQHVSGEAVDVYLPYRKGLFGRIRYGQIFATPGTLAVFVGAQGSPS